MGLTRLQDSYGSWHLPFSFDFRSLGLSLIHRCFRRALYAVLLGGILNRVEPVVLVGCQVMLLVNGKVQKKYQPAVVFAICRLSAIKYIPDSGV